MLKYRPDLIPCCLFVFSCYSFDSSSCKFISNAAITAEIRNLTLNYYVISVQKSEVIALCYVFCWNGLNPHPDQLRLLWQGLKVTLLLQKHHWHELLSDPSSVAWRDLWRHTTTQRQRVKWLWLVRTSCIFLNLYVALSFGPVYPFQVTIASSPSQAISFKSSSLKPHLLPCPPLASHCSYQTWLPGHQACRAPVRRHGRQL